MQEQSPLIQEIEKLRKEMDAYKACLEEIGVEKLELMASKGVEFSRTVGAAFRLIMLAALGMSNTMKIRVVKQVQGMDAGKWKAFLPALNDENIVSSMWAVGETYDEALENFKKAYSAFPFTMEFGKPETNTGI